MILDSLFFGFTAVALIVGLVFEPRFIRVWCFRICFVIFVYGVYLASRLWYLRHGMLSADDPPLLWHCTLLMARYSLPWFCYAFGRAFHLPTKEIFGLASEKAAVTKRGS